MLNEVSPLCCHALVKLTLLALVPSFAPAGNELRAEQFCHAFEKSVQLEISVVPNELSDEQFLHELNTVVVLFKSN